MDSENVKNLKVDLKQKIKERFDTYISDKGEEYFSEESNMTRNLKIIRILLKTKTIY